MDSDSLKSDPKSEEHGIVNVLSEEKTTKEIENINLSIGESKTLPKEKELLPKNDNESPGKATRKEKVPNNKLQNEFVDYSVPFCVTEEFTEEDLEIIFDTKDKSEKPKVEESPSAETVFILPGTDDLTDKEHLIFKAIRDDRLDFFFQMLRETHKGVLTELLAKSWEKSPLDTLKLLVYMRDCRQGKGLRTEYQHCLYWLYHNHPKTLANNLKYLASFGYWKDLLHLLMTIFFYGIIPHYLEADDSPSIKEKSKIRRRLQVAEIEAKRIQLKVTNARPTPELFPLCKTKKSAKAQLQAQRWNVLNTRVFNSLLLNNIFRMDPEFVLKVPNFEYLPKNERKGLTLKFARFRLQTDVKYRYFHVKIAKLFAEQLQADKKTLLANEGKTGEKGVVSFAGKWAPSVTNHFDKYTLIGTTIALELVRLGNVDLEMVKPYESVRAFLGRKRYHKEYLVPLREYLEIPEVFMSAKLWNKVNYNKVHALSMKRYTNLFLKHDKDRFEEFSSKKNKLPAATHKPIQIITEMMTLVKQKQESNEAEIQILENQWRSLVADIKGTNNFTEALAICDVSGSMIGEPILVALGLTSLVMDLGDSPWNEMCITFHEKPSVCQIDSTRSLHDKIQRLIEMTTGKNTDFNKIYELILKWAEDVKAISPSKEVKLPKTLFIFTSKEFGSAFPGITNTNYEDIKNKFGKAGFAMPNIIFWNLKGDKDRASIPIMQDEHGIILIRGYSGQLLKLIMENQDMNKFNPIKLMETAIANQAYTVLEVFD